LEGEPERGVRLEVVLLLLAELLTDAVLETAEEDRVLVALRATALAGVALLFTFAFGRKVGAGAEV
jgi:hypothetical protein